VGYRTLLGIGTKPSPESLHWGVLRLCRGLDILKFDKNSTDLKCFVFQFREAWSFVWGLRPPWRRDVLVMEAFSLY